MSDVTDSAMVSLGDLADRSDAVRVLAVDRAPGDLAGPVVLKNGEREWMPGLIGEVAIGTKNGSTIGFVIAVCSAVKNRRGPAGLGTTMTSGIRDDGPLAERIV